MRSAEPRSIRTAPGRRGRTTASTSLAALLLVLGGCASGPSVAPPATSTLAAAPAEPAASATSSPASAAVPAGQAAIAPAAQQAFAAAREALAAGRVAEAQQAFETLAREHPELGGAQASLGLIHRRAGRWAESAAAFEQAVQASPGQPVYWNQLGAARRHLGAFEKARAAYERAIELDPAYAAPVLNLAILTDLYLNDQPRALELYQRYQSMLPEADPTVGKWLADLKNRKPKAQRVVSKEPS